MNFFQCEIQWVYSITIMQFILRTFDDLIHFLNTLMWHWLPAGNGTCQMGSGKQVLEFKTYDGTICATREPIRYNYCHGNCESMAKPMFYNVEVRPLLLHSMFLMSSDKNIGYFGRM